MDDDPDTGGTAGWRWSLVVAALAMVVPGAARGQGGWYQVQYDRVEVPGLVFQGDSAATETTFVISSWTQLFRYDHGYEPRPDVTLAYQLGFSDQRFLERGQRVQSPTGQLRLALPRAGAFLSLRPVRDVSTVREGPPGADPQSLTARRSELWSTQGILSAYWAPQGLPRVDASWTRGVRDGRRLASPAVDDRRDVRLAWGLAGLDLRAGYADLARGAGAWDLDTRVYQRSYDASAGYGFTPADRTSASLGYTFGGYDRQGAGGFVPVTYTHRLSASASFAQSPTLDWNLQSSLGSTDQLQFPRTSFRTFESQLSGGWHPGRAFRLQGGGALRRSLLGARTGLERSLTLTASLDGPVRRGWTAGTSASGVYTWAPFRPAFGTTSYRAYSRFALREGVEASLDGHLSANDDTVRANRRASRLGLGLRLRPLRALWLQLSANAYRSGPTLLEARSTGSGAMVDLGWSPGAALEVSANLRHQISGPGVPTRNTSRSASARWSPSGRTQLNLAYTRTENRLGGPAHARPESPAYSSFTTQAILGLTPALQAVAGLGLVHPGTEREAPSYNASMSWRFGR